MYAVILYSIGSPENLTQNCIRQFLNNFLSDRLVVKIPRVIWQPVLHNFILRSRPERLASRYRSIFDYQHNPYLQSIDSLTTKLNESLNLSEEGLALIESYKNQQKQEKTASLESEAPKTEEQDANEEPATSAEEGQESQNNEQVASSENTEQAQEESTKGEEEEAKSNFSGYWQHQTIQPENAGSVEYTNNPVKSLSAVNYAEPEDAKESSYSPSKFYTYSEDLLLTDKALVLENAQYKVYKSYAYIQPSLETAIMDAKNDGAKEIIVIPLFPQFSSTTSLRPAYTLAKIKEEFNFDAIKLVRNYAEHPLYIQALATKIQAKIDQVKEELQQKEKGLETAHLLFSYHSLPKSYIKLGDPYQEEVLATHQAIVKALNLEEQGLSYSLAYQSKMGPMSWLTPDIEQEVKNILNQGKQHLLVVCPNFSIDCLETLYDIERNLKIMFLNQGGDSFTYIPCLNDDDLQVDLLKDLVLNQAKDISEFKIDKLNITC